MRWIWVPASGYAFGVLYVGLRLLMNDPAGKRLARLPATLRIALSWPVWVVAAFAWWGWPWRWPKDDDE